MTGRGGEPARRAGRDAARTAKALPDEGRSDSARSDKARLDAVFGDTLPATTSDERRGRDSHLDDDWWREQRPPHHG